MQKFGEMIWNDPATSVCSEQVFLFTGNVLTSYIFQENVDKFVTCIKTCKDDACHTN